MADILLPARTTARGDRAPRTPVITAESVPNVGYARDPGVNVPAGAFDNGASGLEAAGQGLSQLAQGIAAAAQKQQQLADFTATSDAYSGFQRTTMDEYHRRQTEDDPTRPDFEKDFGGYLDTQIENAMSALPEGTSDMARERMRVKMEGQATALRDSAGVLSVQSLQAKASDAYQETINTLSSQARAYSGALPDLIHEGDSALAGLSLNMTPDQERDQKHALRTNLVQAAIDGEIERGNFAGARALLGDQQTAELFNAQSRGAIENGINTAQVGAENTRLAEERRQEAEANKREQEVADNLYKTGLTLLTDNKLTADWVLQRQDALDTAQFKDLLKSTSAEGATKDNHDVVAALYSDIADGVNVERDVINAFVNDNLTRETMNTILSRNDKAQSSSAPGTPYERATEYLKGALKPSALNDNPDASLAFANAQADLFSYFDENPKTTLKDSMDRAKELVTAYRLAPETTLSLPFPSWMPGDRISKAPNLDKAEADVVQALQAGTITREEAQNRAKVINRWRQVMGNGGVQ